MSELATILLAGGIGSRMKSETPKQFLEINDTPIALYSFHLLQKLDAPIVVVCPKPFHHLFPPKTLFAEPGKERQDSVANALCLISSELVLIHDAARPCVRPDRIKAVIDAAREHGSAVLGTRAKNTIKEEKDGFVRQTLDRSLLWEVSTPQVLRREWLRKGLEKAKQEKAVVTDDVSCAEILGYPTKIVEDHPSNIKLTTPSDLPLISAELLHGKI